MDEFDHANKPSPEDYLMHYGVKGMKWGVRRYQNPDGSLTPEGEKRFQKVSNSRLLRAIDTYDAKWITKDAAREADVYSKIYGKLSDRNRKKISKYSAESKERNIEGDIVGFEVYQREVVEQTAKLYKNAQLAKHWSDKAEASKARFSDISSGKLQAGRDFVTHYENDVYSVIYRNK